MHTALVCKIFGVRENNALQILCGVIWMIVWILYRKYSLLPRYLPYFAASIL